jgi:hypothetical protein
VSAAAWSAVGGIAAAVVAIVALRVAQLSLDSQRQAAKEQKIAAEAALHTQQKSLAEQQRAAATAEARALEDRRDQQDKELRAQATLVSTWSERLLTREQYEALFRRPPDPPSDESYDRWRPVVVLNASESPIYDVETWVFQPNKHKDNRDAATHPSRAHFTARTVVAPKAPFREARAVRGRGLPHPPETGVKFRDLSGNVWWRDFGGTLHHLSSLASPPVSSQAPESP